MSVDGRCVARTYRRAHLRPRAAQSRKVVLNFSRSALVPTVAEK